MFSSFRFPCARSYRGSARPRSGFVLQKCLLVVPAAVAALLPFSVSIEPARSEPAYTFVHHSTSTHKVAAQRCFDRGLTLFYAYNRVASRHAFECAAKLDRDFAMAYWGIALAHGTNINFVVDAAGERAAYAAIHHAIALERNASSAERAYIRALAARYTNLSKPNLRTLALAYERAMKMLAAQYADDTDAATLYAESAMELQAWQWYTPSGAPVGSTSAILSVLQSVIAREPLHIGANHLYIHITEASLHPERALRSAGRLSHMTFEPGAAHLVHMPAHVYMRTGDYALAANINEHASKHDIAYRHQAMEPDVEASAYHDHNLTMVAAG